jgi:hypothetical protein
MKQVTLTIFILTSVKRGSYLYGSTIRVNWSFDQVGLRVGAVSYEKAQTPVLRSNEIQAGPISGSLDRAPGERH